MNKWMTEWMNKWQDTNTTRACKYVKSYVIIPTYMYKWCMVLYSYCINIYCMVCQDLLYNIKFKPFKTWTMFNTLIKIKPGSMQLLISVHIPGFTCLEALLHFHLLMFYLKFIKIHRSAILQSFFFHCTQKIWKYICCGDRE